MYTFALQLILFYITVDEEPPQIDNMLDEIVDAELKAVETYRHLMPQLTPKDHAWIARGMEKRVDEMKESAMKEIMDEVDVSFSFHIFFTHPSLI